MYQIKEVLMKRDFLTEEEALSIIKEAAEDLRLRLEQGELPDDICLDWFGLEPDYIMDLMAYMQTRR